LLNRLDQIIKSSLTDFVEDIFALSWFGREREAISLFAFRYLLPFLMSSIDRFDASQLGIEIAVPQLNGPGLKSQVNKDLVIWPDKFMTCWDDNGQPQVYPLAIMEWKSNVQSLSNRDLKWLADYSIDKDDFIGFVVSLDLSNRKFRLKAGRIFRGSVENNWLAL
jgi:hypothetical protein